MIEITSKIKNYSFDVVDNFFERKDEFLSHVNHDCLFYFIDGNVWNLYETELKRFIGDNPFFVIEAIETNKEYLALSKYYKVLIENGFKRKDMLVTFGGGILQDISGFVASTLYRGIPWTFIPTTFLAQADSCIGSKTSINFEDSKNLIGSFYPPDLVWVDVKFCRTLTPVYFNSGLGEVIKYHLMVDEAKYHLLEEYLACPDLRDEQFLKPILFSSLEIKRSFFEEDEFDTGRRNLLNYGHCLGHALESASNFAVSHGEAVIIGMGFANLLSLRRGILDKKVYEAVEKLLQKHYPRFELSLISVDSLIGYLKRDKKRVSKEYLTMILCRGIGKQQKYDDISEQEIREVYDEFLTTYPQ